METTADGGLQKDLLIKRFLNYNKVAILNPAGILRAVSRSTIALQNRNAAGDEVPLCTQLSFPVISLVMVCWDIGISISVAAEVRAQLIPVTTHKLCYDPQLLMVWGSMGFVPILAAVGVWWWSRTQEWSWSKRMWVSVGVSQEAADCLCVWGLELCDVWNWASLPAFARRNHTVQGGCEPEKSAGSAKNSSKCRLRSI